MFWKSLYIHIYILYHNIAGIYDIFILFIMIFLHKLDASYPCFRKSGA